MGLGIVIKRLMRSYTIELVIVIILIIRNRVMVVSLYLTGKPVRCLSEESFPSAPDGEGQLKAWGFGSLGFRVWKLTFVFDPNTGVVPPSSTTWHSQVADPRLVLRYLTPAPGLQAKILNRSPEVQVEQWAQIARNMISNFWTEFSDYNLSPFVQCPWG